MRFVDYYVTAECLRRGVLQFNPRQAAAVFSGGDRVRAVAPGGEELELELDRATLQVKGLAPLLRGGELEPNDVLRFVPEGDRVTIEVKKRSRRARPLPEAAKPKPKERPAPAPEVRPAPPPPPPVGERPRFVAGIEALGFEAVPDGRLWRFKARLNRQVYTLLAAPEGTLSPRELAEARDRRGADYAFFVTHKDPPPRLVEVGVVSEPALAELAELHRTFPVGALELVRLLAGGRVGRAELEGLRAEIASLLGERAKFSAALLTLARFGRDQLFILDELVSDLGEGLDLDALRKALEVLAGPPFFAVEELPSGEYRLRVSVEELLSSLAAYAEQLKRRLLVSAPAVPGRGSP